AGVKGQAGNTPVRGSGGYRALKRPRRVIEVDRPIGVSLSRDQAVAESNGNFIRRSLRRERTGGAGSRVHERNLIGAELRHDKVTGGRAEDYAIGRARKSRFQQRGGEVRVMGGRGGRRT